MAESKETWRGKVRGMTPEEVGAQLIEARIQTGEDLGRRHGAHSGRRQLDGQRQAIETFAQLLDGQLGRLVGQEIGPALSGALKEQAPGIGGSEWIQPPHGLTVHRERLATRGQDADLRARVQQCRGQLRTFVDNVLAVVKDDQEVALGQVLTERVERFGSTAAPKTEHASGLSCDLGRLCSRGEIDEPYAVEPTR